MTTATGARAELGIIKEVTQGTTPVTPSLKAIPFNSVGLAMTRPKIEDPTIRSDRQQRYSRLGNYSVSGDVVVSLGHGTFDELLEAAMMSTWTANVLKIGTTLSSFTIEQAHRDINQFKSYTGCAVASLKIDIPASALAKATFGFTGMSSDVAATSLDADTYTAADSTKQPFVHVNGTIKVGGATVAYVTGANFGLENGLAANFTLGNFGAHSMTAGMAKVTGQLTTVFENADLIEKFNNEETTTLEFELDDGNSNTLTFYMGKVKFTGATSPVTNDGPITLTLPFDALFDTVSGSLLTVTRSA